jgi:hypothetical protein
MQTQWTIFSAMSESKNEERRALSVVVLAAELF